MLRKLRLALVTLGLASLSACSRPGINAGEDGGVAFIALAVTLILTCVILWLVVGRRD